MKRPPSAKAATHGPTAHTRKSRIAKSIAFASRIGLRSREGGGGGTRAPRRGGDDPPLADRVHLDAGRHVGVVHHVPPGRETLADACHPPMRAPRVAPT